MYVDSDGRTVYDTDNPLDIDLLIASRPSTAPEIYPRRTRYGSPEAMSLGLEPVEDYPSVLIQPSEYNEALAHAHANQTLPIYHMYHTWRPKGTRYNQNGLGYCWTWSGTGCMMTCRGMEDKNTVLLAPVSMGYLVGWSNRGNYLESYIGGARERGVCPVPDGESFNSTNRSSSYWGQYEDLRRLYRLDKIWDTSRSNMTQHCISILCYGRSLYIAYNWWGHALELVGIRMEGNALQWDISNSHNEPDVITLTGSRAVPDEAYGFISTVLAS